MCPKCFPSDAFSLAPLFLPFFNKEGARHPLPAEVNDRATDGPEDEAGCGWLPQTREN